MTLSNISSYRFFISGRVQGVYYRKFVSEKLQALGIEGYVRNLPDGRVEVLARLSEDSLQQVLEVLKKGSPLSEVEDIKIERLDSDDRFYDGFKIVYD